MSCLITMGMTNDRAWERKSNGLNGSVIYRLAQSASDPQTIYAATNKGVYVSLNSGKEFKALRGTQTLAKRIYDLHVPPEDDQIMYLATDQGLFQGNINGQSAQWQRIFYAGDAQERTCRSVIQYAGVLYVGTLKGIFYQQKGQNTWHRLESFPQEPVHLIDVDASSLYIAASTDVYRFDAPQRSLTKIFSQGFKAEQEETFESEEDSEGSVDIAGGAIKSLTVATPQLIVGTSAGIFVSTDRGAHWQSIPSQTLPLNHLTQVISHGLVPEGLVPEGTYPDKHDQISLRFDQPALRPAQSEGLPGLVAGTQKGAFLYEGGRWAPLYQGMGTNVINDLV
ncbi:MAG: hypothetical protein Q7S13_01440, partial [Candidatus Omnitrophota bacterium]|nr:hypothetical protein [Candidatus Omnitrophota bacterium]